MILPRLLLLSLLPVGAAFADDAPAPDPSTEAEPEEASAPPEAAPPPAPIAAPAPGRPTVGVALSGGGALGMAHIGVLLAMEELRIPVDAIAGTSMGGLVGGLYASGLTAEEIRDSVVEEQHTRKGDEAVFREEWLRAFNDAPDRRDLSMRRKADDQTLISGLTFGISDGKAAFPVGIMAGHRQNLLFEQLTLHVSEVQDFSALPIPFRAVGTDIETGQEVTLEGGELASAMRATMAVPGVFAPVVLNGELIVDGGVVDNLPVDDVRDMDVDVVLASWVDLPLTQGSFFSIGSSMMFAMMDQTSERQLDKLTDKDSVIVLRAPTYDDPRANCLKDDEVIQGKWACAPTLIEWGYEQAMAVLKDRTDLQLSEAEYAEWRAAHSRPERAAPPTVDELRVENQSRYSDKVIYKSLERHLGKPFNLDALSRDVDTLYGLGAFEWVSWRLVDEGDRNVLIIETREKSWGPDFFTIGMSVEGGFDGDTDFAITMAHRRLPFNRLGGELQTEAFVGTERGARFEIYQPVEPSMRLFTGLAASAQQDLRPIPPDRALSAEDLAAGEGYDPTTTTVTATATDFRVTDFNLSLFGGVTPTRTLDLRGGYELWYARVAVIGDGTTVETPDPQLIGQFNLRLRHDNLDHAWFPSKGTMATIDVDLGRRQINADPEDMLILAPNAVLASAGGAYSLGRHTLSTYGEYGTISTTVPQADMAAWEAAGADPTTRPSTQPATLGYTIGGLFRLSGYETDGKEGEELVFGRVGYRVRVVDGRVPVFIGGTLEGGWWGDADAKLVLEQELFNGRQVIGGSAYLGMSTPLGPLYIAFGGNSGTVDSSDDDDGEMGVAFYLGRSI